MKVKELRDKTEHELQTVLQTARASVQSGRFKVALKQLKNVREIRAQRNIIARILTILQERKNNK